MISKDLLIEGETICRICLEIIPQNELSPSMRGRNSSICKSCSRKRQKQQYAAFAKKQYHKQYYEKNREKQKEKVRLYKKNNPEKLKEYKNRPESRLRKRQAKIVKKALRKVGSQKSYSVIKYVGCNSIELKKYIESKFQEGMSWDNYGNPNGDHTNCWHIDHIRPISSFDLTNEEQVKICFHYTNLQPLWAEQNLSKGSKWGDG